MARRLILDTGVLFVSKRRKSGLADLIGDDIVTAAITVAELRTDIGLANDTHRSGRTEFLVQVLETLPVEPYDVTVAEAYGQLLAYVHRGGTQRAANDLRRRSYRSRHAAHGGHNRPQGTWPRPARSRIPGADLTPHAHPRSGYSLSPAGMEKAACPGAVRGIETPHSHHQRRRTQRFTAPPGSQGRDPVDMHGLERRACGATNKRSRSAGRRDPSIARHCLMRTSSCCQVPRASTPTRTTLRALPRSASALR